MEEKDIAHVRIQPPTTSLIAVEVKHVLLLVKLFLPVMMYSGAAYPCVPITLVETCVSSPSGPSFAKPKSESFAL